MAILSKAKLTMATRTIALLTTALPGYTCSGCGCSCRCAALVLLNRVQDNRVALRWMLQAAAQSACTRVCMCMHMHMHMHMSRAW